MKLNDLREDSPTLAIALHRRCVVFYGHFAETELFVLKNLFSFILSAIERRLFLRRRNITNRWTRAAGAPLATSWCGEGCFDSRRRVNSDVGRCHLFNYETLFPNCQCVA